MSDLVTTPEVRERLLKKLEGSGLVFDLALSGIYPDDAVKRAELEIVAEKVILLGNNFIDEVLT